MFPVCAGIETSTASGSRSTPKCFPCVRELKQNRDISSRREIKCFPCVRELKLDVIEPLDGDVMFPVCAGIEKGYDALVYDDDNVSRVCGN